MHAFIHTYKYTNDDDDDDVYFVPVYANSNLHNTECNRESAGFLWRRQFPWQIRNRAVSKRRFYLSS